MSLSIDSHAFSTAPLAYPLEQLPIRLSRTSPPHIETNDTEQKTTHIMSIMFDSPLCVRLAVLLSVCLIHPHGAFQPSLLPRRLHQSRTLPPTTLPPAGLRIRSRTHPSCSLNAAEKYDKASPSGTADFEFQEMRVQLDALQKQNLVSRNMDPRARAELEHYVRQVALYRPSPVEVRDIGRALPQTRWKLVFATDTATLGDLPADATVLLNFVDHERVDYILQFSEKTFGLNNLKAKSTYTVNPGPGGDEGVVTLVYDKITTDAFGMKDMGVGLFGMLQGRANYIVSAYFDGTFWVERGRGRVEGTDYLSVYVRQPDEDPW